jgi:hypothetical protein
MDVRKQKNDEFRIKFEKQIHQYYNEASIPNLCVSYLMVTYPYIMPKIDHIAYRFLSKDDWLNFHDIMDDKFVCCGRLDFPRKSTDRYFKHAHWYSHPYFPRVFCSYIDVLESDKDEINIVNETNMTDEEKYDGLKKLDQYLAWTTIWKDDINHIAFDLSDYPGDFEDIIKGMIDELGLKMNRFGKEGDIIMVSQDGLLRQCSTKSDMIKNIPKSYIEFVDRKKDKNGVIRDGFDTFSANNIFESTD